MRIVIDGSVPFLMMFFGWAAGTYSAWWLLGIPLTALTCVVNPRWSKAEGWRLWP